MTHNYREGEEPIAGAGYRLVRLLGRGGFGEVWKATAPGGADAALKIIRLGGAEGRTEFRALQLVKRLHHPSLLPLNAFWLKSGDGSVLDESAIASVNLPGGETRRPIPRATMVAPAAYALEPTELIIAMGLGDKSLFDRLQECLAEGLPGVPDEELLGYMEDAARAIDFLNRPIHDLGSGPVAIQHCDIKPHNLLIVGGAVQVCDFGLARMMGADRTTSAAATIAYAAPECLESGNPSPTTDQYSLAVSYYEMRTGRLPYADETLVAVIMAKRSGDLDLSALSEQEQAVLRRATAPDPAGRYPNACDMVKALRESVLGDTRGVRTRQTSHARGWWAAAVLVVFAVVAAASTAGFLDWQPFATRDDAPAKTNPVAIGDRHTSEGPERVGEASVAKAGPIAAPTTPNSVATKTAGPKVSAPPQKEAVKASVTPAAVDELLRRGTGFLEQHQHDKAIAAFTEAIGLAPGNDRLHSRRGAALFMSGKFQDAVDDFSLALKITPDARDYVNRGRAYRALERLDEALADFNEAVRLDPQDADAVFFRGQLHQARRQYDKAVVDLSQAIELAPRQGRATFPPASAYESRGLCQMLVERLDEALLDFTEAIRLGPENPAVVHELRAGAFELKDRAESAKYDHQIAAAWKRIQEKPDDGPSLRQLADLLTHCPEAALCDPKKAVQLATRACELSGGKDGASLDALAAAYAASGQPKEAVKWAQKAVEAATVPADKDAYGVRLQRYRKLDR